MYNNFAAEISTLANPASVQYAAQLSTAERKGGRERRPHNCVRESAGKRGNGGERIGRKAEAAFSR